ncbi:MAG: GNAT family N-acetyltransferase [Anaerolineae bacterium]|nr:GNAT family N-acetyltransferase [Anaerolineae bacterium]
MTAGAALSLPVRTAQGYPYAIRTPRPDEAGTIPPLFEDEVRAGRMLPRDPVEVRTHIGDWLIATLDEETVGCVSLVFYSDVLCELRSLAVAPTARSKGIGGHLIEAAVEMAYRRGMRRVLTLTRRVHLFERHGFRRDVVMNYPEKVWKDCAPCPFREMCDEVALIYHITPLFRSRFTTEDEE